MHWDHNQIAVAIYFSYPVYEAILIIGIAVVKWILQFFEKRFANQEL